MPTFTLTPRRACSSGHGPLPEASVLRATVTQAVAQTRPTINPRIRKILRSRLAKEALAFCHHGKSYDEQVRSCIESNCSSTRAASRFECAVGLRPGNRRAAGKQSFKTWRANISAIWMPSMLGASPYSAVILSCSQSFLAGERFLLCVSAV